MQLDHMVPETADRADIPALPPALDAGQILGGEQGLRAGGAAEDGIRFADVLFDEAVVLAVFVAHDAEAEFLVRVPEVLPFGGCVDGFHQLAGALEAAVDDVDVVDIPAAEEEGEADVPEGLEAGAENADGVDGGAAGEDCGGGEGGAEGGEG